MGALGIKHRPEDDGNPLISFIRLIGNVLRHNIPLSFSHILSKRWPRQNELKNKVFLL